MALHKQNWNLKNIVIIVDPIPDLHRLGLLERQNFPKLFPKDIKY